MAIPSVLNIQSLNFDRHYTISGNNSIVR